LTSSSELEAAFDAAIAQAQQAANDDMVTLSGEPARPQLDALIRNLEVERAKAVERGSIDREWFQTTLRWVVEWAPETDLTLIAALGRITRVSPRIDS
jgi:hypothetical protein